MSKDDPTRATRLAAALRANLRRRKEQARAHEVPAPPEQAPDDRSASGRERDQVGS